MKLKTSLLLFLILIQHPIIGQQLSPVVVGQSHTLTSEILQSERNLLISLPDDYQPNEKYPVLYVLDGKKWFLEAVSKRQILRSYDYVPPFIVVGVPTDDQPRYGFFNNAERLQNHLEQEVIPYIENQYSSSPKRMVAGWQFASAFLIQTLAQKPTLFDAWFAASPFPIQGNRLNLLKTSLENGSLTSGTLVFATSLNENSVEGGAQELAALLEAEAPENLRWHYAKLKNEATVSAGHRTTPMGTLYQGLRTYFEDYPVLEFNTHAQYKALGGFDYVERYYQQRSSAYGFSSEIPEEGMFFLIRMCMDANEVSDFHFFMQKFKDTDFFANNNLGWNMRFAAVYMENEQYENALKQFETIASLFSESPRPIYGMAKAYEALGQKENALKHYERTVSLATAANDRNLKQYQDDLDTFKKGM